MHSRTTVGQKLPDNWEEKVTNFHQFASQRKEELAIQAGRVFNMDEVPMSFDAPYSRTVHTTGAQSISVLTMGHEKTGFTVVLACSESGKKLKLMVIFKRKTMPKEKLPDGVVVHCHNKGWVDRDGMAIWGEKVWDPRPVSFFDSFSAHIDEGVRNTFKTEHKTTTAVIPGGLTKTLQLLIGHLRTMLARSGRNGCRKEFTPSPKLER